MTPHTPLSALDPHTPVRLFPDDEFRVVNAVDASKQLAFDLSAIATETTRTVTIPDASGTMALLERAQTFTKLATFALGLTVAGAAFASRGIQDNATARALTLSGSGANHVTIANSANAPVIGTTGNNLYLTPALGVVELNGYAVCNFVARSNTTGTSGLFLSNATSGARGHFQADNTGNAYLSSYGAGGAIYFYTGGGADAQVAVLPVAGANRHITAAGSNGGSPTIGTSAGNLALAPSSNIVTVSGQANIGVGYANYINVIGSAGTPQITTAGGATVPLDITTVGGAVISLKTNGYKQVEIVHTPTPAGYLKFTGGTNPNISVSAGYLEFASGVIFSSQTVGTTVGAAGGASALPATPLGYLTTNINGTACKIPYYTA